MFTYIGGATDFNYKAHKKVWENSTPHAPFSWLWGRLFAEFTLFWQSDWPLVKQGETGPEIMCSYFYKKALQHQWSQAKMSSAIDCALSFRDVSCSRRQRCAGPVWRRWGAGVVCQSVAVCERHPSCLIAQLQHSLNWGELLFSISCKSDKQTIPVFCGASMWSVCAFKR